MKTGVPIPLRYRPHLFRAGGTWRVWFDWYMPPQWVRAAHAHSKILEGIICRS